MMQFIARGGITMIPIIIVSVFALAIVIEKLLSLTRFQKPSPVFLASILGSVRKREWEIAETECRNSNNSIAKVFEAGLSEARKKVTDLRSIEEAMQIKGDEIMHGLETGLKFLASVITLLPLLGLVGTIFGLILAFQKWEVMGASVTISDLAGGIYHAMITTATGLGLLVPYYIIYNFFMIKVDTIELQLARYTTEFLSQIRNSSLHTEKSEPALLKKISIERPAHSQSLTE